MAPAHVLPQQDPPDLGAVDVDTLAAEGLGEAVEGPHSGCGLVGGGQLTPAVADQASRWGIAGQLHDPGPLGLGDAGLAAGSEPVGQSVQTLLGEALYPVPGGLRRAAQLRRDGWNPGVGPAQFDDLRSADPVRRGVPRTGQFVDRALLGLIRWRAGKQQSWHDTSPRHHHPSRNDRSTRAMRNGALGGDPIGTFRAVAEAVTARVPG